jgi:membrane protein DedA with SNARE-associated domain
MNAIVQFVLKHGYAILFAALFAHQIGVPLPGPLFLLAAGALAATGNLAIFPILLLAVIAIVLADWPWYEAGRRRGMRVLHFIHRLSRDPEFHDRRAKATFSRYGPPILLISKFVPGLDAVAPPLAGISHTSRLRFLAFDAIGASLYSCAYAGLGYVFSHNLDLAAAYVGRAGTISASIALSALLIYAGHTLVRRLRPVRGSRIPPITHANPTKSEDLDADSCKTLEGLERGN